MANWSETYTSQYDYWKGENNTKTGDDGTYNSISGDTSVSLYGYATGGDDTLTGGANSLTGPYNKLYGDALAYLWESSKGGNDVLIGGANSWNYLYGDAGADLRGSPRGGDDVLTGGDHGRNYIYGDAGGGLYYLAAGGADTVTGGAYSDYNFMYGDAGVGSLWDSSNGGNDTLVGGAHAVNNIASGDAPYLYGASKGGNDILVGGSNSTFNSLYGDAEQTLYDYAVGGNDTLTGGASSTYNYLYGDARTLANQTQGGDDVLTAGAGSTGWNWLYGDALNLYSRGGNDTLISGSGIDLMWGDAATKGVLATTGRDVFVFDRGNNQDTINDFEQGKDLIDLSALDLFRCTVSIPVHKMPAKALAVLKAHNPHFVLGFDVLDSNANDVLDNGDGCVSVVSGNTVIDLGAAVGGAAGVDTVTVIGWTALAASDFVF